MAVHFDSKLMPALVTLQSVARLTYLSLIVIKNTLLGHKSSSWVSRVEV